MGQCAYPDSQLTSAGSRREKARATATNVMVFQKGYLMNITKRRTGSWLLSSFLFPVAYWIISKLDGEPMELKHIALTAAIYSILMAVFTFAKPLTKKEASAHASKP